jgi:RNA polymerase sigma factor (sigma-70 family)
MKDWRKYRNYRRYKAADSSYTYVIRVDGVSVEVSKEVYMAYASSARQMEYMEHDLKRDRVLQDAYGKLVRGSNGQPAILPEREVSLDKLIGEDWTYSSADPSPEEILLKACELETLREALTLLDANERDLIETLFFMGMTERELSKRSGIALMTLNDRKHRILRKLKKYLSK